MLLRTACMACLVMILAVSAVARASDLTDFNTAVEAAEAHNRAAIADLGASNVALAARELGQLRTAWRALDDRFAGKPPDVFKGNHYYGIAMTDISARLVTANLMINSGHPHVAREALQALRNDLYNLRKSAGILVLSDCIRDSGTVLDALMVYDTDKLDWNNPQIRADIAAKGAGYGHALDRCDAMAGTSGRNKDDFRRLIDGARKSVALIAKAIATHDGKLLRHIFDQLRAFDKGLEARFG
jgi:hypothetical protein